MCVYSVLQRDYSVVCVYTVYYKGTVLKYLCIPCTTKGLFGCMCVYSVLQRDSSVVCVYTVYYKGTVLKYLCI